MTSPTRHRGRHGFTLTEILIAIGILGVGLAMLAALFPTAIKESSNSTADIVGTMICRNGLAVAKAKLVYGTFNPGATLTDQTAAIDSTASGDSVYPCAAAGTTRGWMLLGKMTPNTNDYTLVLVSYQKLKATNTVGSKLITCNIGANALSFPAGGNVADIKPGTPIIDAATGMYTTVTAVDVPNTIVYLDHALSAAVSTFYVVQESDAGTLKARSPAMSVLVTRTALKQP